MMKSKILLIFLLVSTCISVIFTEIVFAQNIEPISDSKMTSNSTLEEDLIPSMLSHDSKIKSNMNPKIQSALMSPNFPQGMSNALSQTNNPRVTVVIELSDPSDNNIQNLKSFGATLETSYENLVQVSLPYQAIEQISNLDFVDYIRSPNFAVPDITSEGAAVIKSNIVNSRGNTGQGVKVAVIDGGYNLSDPEISSNIVESKSFRADNNISPSGNTDHGTAVAQIIVDVAPDVELHLYNTNTDVEWLNLVDYIIARGDIDIISMSEGWFGTGAYDGSNLFAQKVNLAKSNGILWVNSAGNSAEEHWSGTFSDPDADGFHEFAGSDSTIDISVSAGSKIWLELTWNETWGSSSSDYDLYLVSPSPFTTVASSTNLQDGNDNPHEKISYVVPSTGTYHILIYKKSGVTKELELFSIKHDLSEYQVASSSIISPADATGSLTVGATNYVDNSLESFSSRGPTNDGRIKPDVSAPDGVTTTTAFNPFFGTSASAPYVAGAAALIKSAYPTHSPSDIQSILEQTTVSNHAKNNNDGTGIIDANAAESVCTPPSSGTWTIAVSCTMSASATAPGSVLVQDNSVLTVPAGVTLDINFSSFNLTVKSGSGVLIKSGGKIT